MNHALTLSDRLSLSLAPLLPLPLFYTLAALALGLLALALWRRAPGSLWRMLSFVFLFALLANPVIEQATRTPVKDIAFLVVDESRSQDLGQRRAQLAQAVPALRQQLQQFTDLEVRELHVSGRENTALAAALAQAAAEVPAERRAGAVLLSDGLVHDAEDNRAALRQLGPVHLLLTGQPDEVDRRIVLEAAPHYGLVGKSVTLKLRVLDEPDNQSTPTQLMLRGLNGDDQLIDITTGRTVTVELPIAHGGDNIFTLAVPPLRGELTTTNNRAVVRVQGIRDKLKVLMVSGDPHPVERTWRNLLRADTAVELVHFTILRPPYKQDGTPTHELSLIGFPIQELFQDKIRSFDLIIFDRFRKQGMLPMPYFENIASYVEAGGAFLDASGASYVTGQSLFQTPLSRILPTQPLTRLRTETFIPRLTTRGTQHPVTQALEQGKDWGPWYHQTETRLRRGETLMTGIDGLPLLVLDHVGKGRVAQLHSDSMWLWARGHQGGGPAAELLRRIAHWLMKEPELEEDRLRLEVAAAGDDYQLRLIRPTATPGSEPVSITAPDGSEQNLTLEPSGESATATLLVKQVGAYLVRFRDKEQMVVVGDPNAPEQQQLLASANLLQPVLDDSGGGAFWLAEHPNGVTLQRTTKHDSQHGSDWLGLRRNGESLVTGQQAEALLPAWGWLLLLTATIMLGWRREGR